MDTIATNRVLQSEDYPWFHELI